MIDPSSPNFPRLGCFPSTRWVTEDQAQGSFFKLKSGTKNSVQFAGVPTHSNSRYDWCKRVQTLRGTSSSQHTCPPFSSTAQPAHTLSQVHFALFYQSAHSCGVGTSIQPLCGITRLSRRCQCQLVNVVQSSNDLQFCKAQHSINNLSTETLS